MRNVYTWLLEKSQHPSAPWWLALVSFSESFVSFVPPDPLMIPMIVARKEKAWILAFITTVSSVLGGILGYVIGFYLFDWIGIPILKYYGLLEKMAVFQNFFNEWGFWAIVAKALTPIPFKLVTITAGALKFNLPLFVAASLVSRGIRFYVEAALVWKFGDRIHALIQKNTFFLASLLVGVLIFGFLILYKITR